MSPLIELQMVFKIMLCLVHLSLISLLWNLLSSQFSGDTANELCSPAEAWMYLK